MYECQVEDFLSSTISPRYRGRIQLLLTSPPFPLNRKKEYGNRVGDAYVRWLEELAGRLADMLSPNGSIVLELGNAWVPRKPLMSTLPMESLLAFLKAGRLSLCQQFVSYNPAKLPTPVIWVNRERIRVKDSFTHLWWMSRSDSPKANNRAVLQEYSDSMKALLAAQDYNAGPRPSGHVIGQRSFLTNNGGAIPGNVIRVSNTASTDSYMRYCTTNGLPFHPARMPQQVASFFINFLTDPGDVVWDPFAGSNVTGAVAERCERRWIATECVHEYVLGSAGRFGSVRWC